VNWNAARRSRLNEEEFKEKNGDAAFKAMKALGETFLTKINEVTL